MNIRLADVAAHVGVSVATVSRVLNGKPGIAEQTRREVLQALEQLGYDRSPVRHQAGRIGLIVPELDNPIFPRFAMHIGDALVAHGYAPLLCSATPVFDELDHIQILLDCRVAGMIFVAGRHANTEADHSRYHELRAAGMPLVCVNGYLPGLDATFVSTDDVQAIESAYRHLYSLGHRRIGCAMGPARYISTKRKVQGFLRGAENSRNGSRPAIPDIEQELVVYTVYSVEGGQSAAASLLDRGVTAIVCGNDQLALGIIKTAHARGMRVPEDLSVIGYDDSLLNAYTDPPLTTMRQNVEAISVGAVNALMHALRHGPTSSRETLLPTDLVVRGSTGPAPQSN